MTDADFPRSVAVYGTGLIGSSFGLALRNRFPGIRVYGVDSPETLDRARRIGAVETGDASAADLSILAAPVGAILQLLEELPPGSPLILDVGSTKVDICRRAERLGLAFVGGHPMTGSERSGPEAASAGLFEAAPFFLCPISTTPPDAVARLQRVLERLGTRPVVISPEEHDRFVAQVSHLPQILSTLLADHTLDQCSLAGPGWKSFTRLAASPFHVWRDILATSGSLSSELEFFMKRLEAVLGALKAGDLSTIETAFERANRAVRESNCE